LPEKVLSIGASLKPYVIVFIASACGLILEIVAARILAPSIGVSLYTWTSIIGVVLAGISIGNYLGGRVADRFPAPTTLGIILLAGGLTSLSVLPLIGVASAVFEALPIVPRIVLLTATLFFVPSAVLGMVTPLVVKLNLRDLEHTGDVVGKIYAVSTAGAIFGVFITGFFLVQWLGTRQTILLVALVLVVMSLVLGGLWRAKMPTLPMMVLFVGLGGFSSYNGDFNGGCLTESNYFCIQVTDDIVEGRHKVKALHLDKLLHSYVSLEDPTLLAYDYEKVFADLISVVAQDDPGFRALLVGGGGYTVPRYLETVYPESRVEVVEIDPAVTRVAFDHLGLRRDTQIITYNEDARMAVPKLESGQYGLVIGDAFNDLSVPYHLTTREFNEQIAGLLTEKGIYAVNVVDKFQSGEFARAFVNTLKETFPYVYVIREDENWGDDRQKTHVVAASKQPLTYEAIESANLQEGRGEPVSHFMPDETLTGWLGNRENVLLTDDHAPVDNMLAALHLEWNPASRVRDKALRHYNDGVELEAQGRMQDSIAAYSLAVRLDPTFARAYVNRGNVLYRLGQHIRAIQDSDEAIRLDPQRAIAYSNRGGAFMALGQLEKAIKDLDDAVRLDPELAIAYANRSAAFLAQNRFEEALQDSDEAIRLDPNLAIAYANRGGAFIGLGRPEKTIQNSDEAIRLDAGNAEAYSNRGVAHSMLAQPQQAILDFGQAIVLRLEHPDARLNRGAIYVTLGEYEKAIGDLDQVINLTPGSDDAHYNRGTAHLRLGNIPQSVEDYSQAIQFNANYALAYAGRSIAHTILGADGQAEADFQRAVELGIESSDLLRQEIDQRRSQR